MQHTEEQLAIIEAATTTNASIIINARAGSGKTTTLKLVAPRLRGSTAIIAFNRQIADELKAKITPALSGLQAMQTDISTAHSAGLRAFKRNGRNAKTLGGKLSFMLGDMLKRERLDDDVHRNARHISKLVSHAKNSGFGITGSTEHFPSIHDEEAWRALIDHHDIADELEGDFDEEDLIEWGIKLLLASNARQDSIDFDDMIYLPLLLNLNIPQYDNVLVDEAQDINGTRRELMFRMVKPGGRVIAVGDPNQAIYGFTGADVRSLDKIRDRAGAIELPLSICWRSDALIIAEAQKIVPSIQAKPGAAEGQVITTYWDIAKDAILADGETHGMSQVNGDFLSLPQAGDAILCRLNKPNVAVALGLIRRGKAARIEGRDIGNKLLDHVKKSTPMYAHQPLADTLIDLDIYLENETQKLLAKKRETAIAMLEDEVDAAKLLIERVLEEARELPELPGHPGFEVLEAKVNQLFGDQLNSRDIITLSSVHKSKGREWGRVFILGWKDYMPFHIAAKRGGWALEQEHNLRYVAQTRAEHALIYVNGVQSAIDRGLHREVAKAA